MKAIGKSTVSQYILLHHYIMDATKELFVSRYKTISVNRGILQYNGVYRGITNAGGEESISRYNSTVSRTEKELYRNTRRCIAIQAKGVEGEVISQYNFIISQYNSLSCSRVISQCNELYCNISH